jgi:hypothetical protein
MPLSPHVHIGVSPGGEDPAPGGTALLMGICCAAFPAIRPSAPPAESKLPVLMKERISPPAPNNGFFVYADHSIRIPNPMTIIPMSGFDLLPTVTVFLQIADGLRVQLSAIFDLALHVVNSLVC